jgi:hypothetical protein
VTKKTLLLYLASFIFMASVTGAQTQVTFIGTCDQYQSNTSGDYCINVGSATMWQPFTGDVVNLRGAVTCSPTNTSQCGKLTVQGLNGLPFVGTLANGQTWCANTGATAMIPCTP